MSQETLITKTTNGSKKILIGKMVSKGNLEWLYQRLDIAILLGDEKYPNRVYLKNGKIKTEEADFRNDKETAQGYYITYDGEITQLIKYLLSAHLKKLKLDENWNERVQELMIHQYVNMVINTFRER